MAVVDYKRDPFKPEAQAATDKAKADAAAANSVPALRRAVADLAAVVAKLIERVG